MFFQPSDSGPEQMKTQTLYKIKLNPLYDIVDGRQELFEQ